MIALEVTAKGRNTSVDKGPRALNLVKEDIPIILRGELIFTARQFLIQEQRRKEFPDNDFITLVDNKVNSNERSVRPFGSIEYKTKLETLQPVLLFAARAIDERSPIGRGSYLRNNVLFKNNVFVAKGFTNIVQYISSDNDANPGDIYRFVNISPYARKLERFRVRKGERGFNTGGGLKKGKIKNKIVTIPAGAYVLANRSIKRKFKELRNNVRFSFLPIDPSVARQLDTSGSDTTGHVFAKGRAKGAGKGRPYLYPTITITATKQSVSFNRGLTESGS